MIIIFSSIFTFISSIASALGLFALLLSDKLPINQFIENSGFAGLLRFLLFVVLFIICRKIIKTLKFASGIGAGVCTLEGYIIGTALFELIISMKQMSPANPTLYLIVCGITTLIGILFYYAIIENPEKDTDVSLFLSKRPIAAVTAGHILQAVVIFFFINHLLYSNYTYNGIIPVVIAVVFAVLTIAASASKKQKQRREKAPSYSYDDGDVIKNLNDVKTPGYAQRMPGKAASASADRNEIKLSDFQDKH